MKKHLAFGILAVLSSAPALSAQTTVTAFKDTYLRGSPADNTFIRSNQILIGTHATVGPFNGLFSFDLSGISAEITSITLTLTGDGNSSGSSDLSVFELAAANADWLDNPGTSSGDNVNIPSTVGASGATYSQRQDIQGVSGTAGNWAGSVGAETAGTDYINTLLSSGTGLTSSVGSTIVLGSTSNFVTAANNARTGDDILDLAIYGTTTGTNFLRIQSIEGAGTGVFLTISTVPEPSAYGLIAGMLALSWVMVRRRS